MLYMILAYASGMWMTDIVIISNILLLYDVNIGQDMEEPNTMILSATAPLRYSKVPMQLG